MTARHKAGSHKGRAVFHPRYKVFPAWALKSWFSSKPSLEGRAGFHPRYRVFPARVPQTRFFSKSSLKGRIGFHPRYRVFSARALQTWFFPKPSLKGRAEFHPRYRVFTGPGSLNLVFLKTKSQRKGRGAGFDPWTRFDTCKIFVSFPFCTSG
jgi:hypothetical protein